MIEDTVYRTSSQYRFWSFTEDSLRTLRAKTNASASERVRTAIQTKRQSGLSSTGDTPVSTPGSNVATDDGKLKAKEDEIQCLTPEEEQVLVRYYCEQTLELGDVYKPALPTIVRATAIQYLHRFYLTNSPMTYHPKTIMSCALFLATKTENYYMSLRQFAKNIPGGTPEDVIAPEFLLMQSLRFTFDVRHPFRGLEGGVMELNAIAQGMGQPAPHLPHQTPEDLRKDLLSILPQQGQAQRPTSITDRIARAHGKAREILKTAAQVTDVYFLYTPAQIWLSAFFLADKPLAEFYLNTKLGPDQKNQADQSQQQQQNSLSALRGKVLKTITHCSNTLQSYKPLSSDIEQMKNLKRIAKKLYHCQNPEKIGAGVSQKRDASAAGSGVSGAAADSGKAVSESGQTEPVSKKRRLESAMGDGDNKGISGQDLANRVKEE